MSAFTITISEDGHDEAVLIVDASGPAPTVTRVDQARPGLGVPPAALSRIDIGLLVRALLPESSRHPETVVQPRVDPDLECLWLLEAASCSGDRTMTALSRRPVAPDRPETPRCW